MTWPLATDLNRLISDRWDPLLNAWILHWGGHEIWRHPLNLFNGNIFHPARLTLAFSENLIGLVPFTTPLYVAGMNPIAVYNVMFLLGMALSGFGAWALARELTGSGVASLFAGALFAFAPFRFDHLAHIQMQWAGFLALFLLFLWRYLHTGRVKDLVWFAVFFTWNGLTCIYYTAFGGFALVLTLTLLWFRIPPEEMPRRLVGVAKAISLSILVLAPFYLPYALASRAYKFHRSIWECATFSGVPSSFLSAGFRNKLYGTLTAPWSAGERQLFPGLLPIGLAIAGVWLSRRSGGSSESGEALKLQRRQTLSFDLIIAALLFLRIVVAVTGGIHIKHLISIHEPFRLSFLIALLSVTRLWIAFPARSRYANLPDFLRRTPTATAVLWGISMTVLGVLVALGTNGFFYRELYEIFRPLLGAIRGAARGIILAHLGLGVLGSLALARFAKTRARRPRFALQCAFIAALLFELRAAPIEWYRFNSSPTAESAWLAQQHFEGGVLELPAKTEENTEYEYRTVEHGHAVVNGYSGFFPPAFDALEKEFRDGPTIARTLPMIQKLDTRLVIFHPERCSGKERVEISSFLNDALAKGLLAPIAYFSALPDRTLAFELVNQPDSSLREIRDVDEGTRGKMLATLEAPGLPNDAPTGYLDFPKDGHVVGSAEITGVGWASCEAGIDRVEVRLDGKFALLAPYGGPRPDVLKVLPNLPCRGNCGFSFHLDHVPAGRHSLGIVLKAKNGKVTVLEPKTVTINP